MRSTAVANGGDRCSVLLIAESANPDWVSVPLVGWQIANALRTVADVHIVTQVRNKAALLNQGLIEGKDFTALDTEAVAAPAARLAEVARMGSGKGWTTMAAVHSFSYPYFERAVWQCFGERIAAKRYDIVHRVTPLSPTAPSLLARRCRRCGVPFVLGPLNGGLPWPPGYGRARLKEREWLSFVRGFYTLLPAIRSTYANAAAVIAGSTHTASELARFGRPVIYIPENGIDLTRFPPRAPTPASGKLQLIFVGRLVPYKGADIAIEACAAMLRAGQAELHIIGDGPQRGDLEALIDELGLAGRVVMHGWRSQLDVAAALRTADLLVFPSIREFGGGVVIEAMASGAIPIVVDYGGPAELVDDCSGFRVPLGSRLELTERFAALLANILDRRAELSTMSSAARERILNLFTWEQKACQIRLVYDWVVAGTGGVPRFEFW